MMLAATVPILTLGLILLLAGLVIAAAVHREIGLIVALVGGILTVLAYVGTG